jgi:hypothetical protein
MRGIKVGFRNDNKHNSIEGAIPQVSAKKFSFGFPREKKLATR